MFVTTIVDGDFIVKLRLNEDIELVLDALATLLQVLHGGIVGI